MITLYILTLVIKAVGLCVEACFIIAGQVIDFVLSFVVSFVRGFIEAAILEYMRCKYIKSIEYTDTGNIITLLPYEHYKETL